jgi:hypothetical protein
LNKSPVTAAFALVLALGTALAGCGKKKEDAPIPPPPMEGSASSDELSLAAGTARALDPTLAPSSAKWLRVLSLDDKRAVIVGEVTGETLALFTENSGKTWRAFRSEREGWANWSVGLDGTMVAVAGKRDGAASTTGGTVESTKVAFGTTEAGATLSPPLSLFPTLKGPVKGMLDSVTAIPFLLSPELTGVVGDAGRQQPTFFFGGKPGSEAVLPLKLPAGGEKFIAVPYGRPPALLSIRGRDVLVRPGPQANKPLDKPGKIAGLLPSASALTDLSNPPACESGGLSFQRLKLAANRSQVVAISAEKQVAFALPDVVLPGGMIGCSKDRVVAETTVDPASFGVRLVTCTFDGKCVIGENNAFRVWPSQHEQTLVPVVTDKGVVAVLAEKAGDRWGLYVAASSNGQLYEQSRVIAEGKGDRGRLEFGALLPFGGRVVIILSAEITGTSRRGWFSLASDDGGLTWGPP